MVESVFILDAIIKCTHLNIILSIHLLTIIIADVDVVNKTKRMYICVYVFPHE